MELDLKGGHMRVTIAQLNPVVGDVQGNLDRLRRMVRRSAETSRTWWFSPSFSSWDTSA